MAETDFVSFLGTEALAGVSLVFPLFMLMQMMSNAESAGALRCLRGDSLALGMSWNI